MGELLADEDDPLGRWRVGDGSRGGWRRSLGA